MTSIEHVTLWPSKYHAICQFRQSLKTFHSGQPRHSVTCVKHALEAVLLTYLQRIYWLWEWPPTMSSPITITICACGLLQH